MSNSKQWQGTLSANPSQDVRSGAVLAGCSLIAGEYFLATHAQVVALQNKVQPSTPFASTIDLLKDFSNGFDDAYDAVYEACIADDKVLIKVHLELQNENPAIVKLLNSKIPGDRDDLLDRCWITRSGVNEIVAELSEELFLMPEREYTEAEKEDICAVIRTKLDSATAELQMAINGLLGIVGEAE